MFEDANMTRHHAAKSRYGALMSSHASYDRLTSLPDRVSFLDYLHNELDPELGQQRQSALLLIDLDDFKAVNQSLGYVAGDRVLKVVVTRLLDTMRDRDLLARLNGDEFALLVSDVGDVREMESLAERLLQVISEPYLVDQHELILHCSIGITLFVCDGREAGDILQNVETALSRAKQDGKNSYRHFAVEMNTSVRRRVAISNALQLSVQSNMRDFSLAYQPRLDLASGIVSGVEALLRWHNEELGNVSPAEFIPIAEQNGTISILGDWVLSQACWQVVVWQEQLGVDVMLAVNLSAKQFRDAKLARTVSDVLEQTGLAPRQLELELTESMLMHDIPRTVSTLHELKRIGVRLAIDDFGTGYSSLSYLKDFPLDYLKVDRSFVAHVPDEPKERAIVQAVIGMAHLLDLKVIAEGVETDEQLRFMLAQDCDEIQGFIFSRPASAEAIAEMIQQKRGLASMRETAFPY